MKDIFAERAVDNFWEIMNDFLESLAGAFPDCPDTKEWKMWITNIVATDPKKRAEGVERWAQGLQAPLQKGCAKYAKAVASITGSPACVYHAVAYKDIDAAHASNESMQSLGLPDKLRSDTMTEKDRVVFWRYMDELNKHAMTATGGTPPKVPSSEEIANDIQRRKGGGLPLKPQSLQHGLHDLWKQLCESRGCPVTDDLEGLGAKLMTLDDGGVAARCRAREEAAFAEVASVMALGGDPPTEEQWTLLDKAFGLATMERAIPAPMMRGIESVANRLVKDLASGSANLESLDIESIGKEVLSSVPTDTVSSFADNIEKILPALQRMHPDPH